MNAPSDEQLMASLLVGCRDSLGVLYERYDGMVKTVIGRFAPEISAAERDELVQDVFITVDGAASRFPEGVPFRSWLVGIAVNKTRHWRRNTWLRRCLLKKRARVGVGMALAVNNCPEQKALLRQSLSGAIYALPVNLRDVFVLHATEGFSGDEIAGILNISPKTVRTRLYRARKRLLASLDNDSFAIVDQRTNK